MEHQAQKEVKLSDGKSTEVRSIRTKEVPQIGMSIATLIVHMQSAKDSSPSAIFSSASQIIVDAVMEILALCTTLEKTQVEELPLCDTIKLFEAWMEVSKVEEIGPAFFRIVKTAKKAKEQSQ